MSEEEGWKAVREQVEEIAKEVVEWERTWDVIYGLHTRGLLTEANVGHLRSLNTRTEQVRQLVGLLAAGCGDVNGNLSVFLEVLQEKGLHDLVGRLDPGNAYSSSTFRENSDAVSALRLTPFQHPTQDWTEGDDVTFLPSQTYPPLPQPHHDITNNNQNMTTSTCESNTTAMKTQTLSTTIPVEPVTVPRVPVRVSVVPCREIGGRQFPQNEVYKNESEPRGYVFLVNYKDFADGDHGSRVGSEIDMKNLMQLFTQMGYKICCHVNLTKYQTIQELRKFRDMEEHGKVDSCIVIFMSHGRDDQSFYTSDNHYFTVHNVVDYFNNRVCPLLQGKPKIFMFQFCRGPGPDVGVDSSTMLKLASNVKGLNVTTDSSTFGEHLVKRDPTYTDMYIVYSTVGGFVSYRHPDSGSWLVEAICEIFMKDACNTELDHLMKTVSRRVRSYFSTEGNKQACEFVLRAFDRHFFFNPKPLASLCSLNLRQLGEVLPPLQPIHHRRRTRTSSPAATAKTKNIGGARSRHFSGENTHSEDLDVLDHSQTPAFHPRIKNLTTSQRRMSAPESSNQACAMILGHNFNDLNSEGSSPEPSESSETGAASWASMERLSPLENSQQQWNNNESQEVGACGGKSSTESPTEGFPLLHSQSALETVQPSDLGGLTGLGPEVRAVEEMRPSFKRQLSAPSNNETLQKVNDVRRYLQINDSDEALIHPLKRIESFINKKKTEGKRRKVGEPNSLDY